jgi:hypothetical protein
VTVAAAVMAVLPRPQELINYAEHKEAVAGLIQYLPQVAVVAQWTEHRHKLFKVAQEVVADIMVLKLAEPV